MQVKNQDQEIIYTHRTKAGDKARVLAVVNNIDFPYVIAVLTNNEEHVNQYSILEFNSEFFEYNLWEHVEVDTPILVRTDSSEVWCKRHFAKYEDGKVFTWYAGCTSWSSPDFQPTAWDFAKLLDKE